MKQILLDKINSFLLKKGFTVKNISGCFDVLGRKASQILLIKVLEDANSISKLHSEEMINVAAFINASPLIVTEKAGSRLEENIVYSRFDIYTLNMQTFIGCINNKFPFVKRTKAGLTASIDGTKLKEKRESEGISLNSLSKKIGVTSRMVVKYENENSEITINKALKLYDVFGDYVFNEVNVFKQKKEMQSKFENEVTKKYIELGFNATGTKKTPFDVIAKSENELILTRLGDKVDPDPTSLAKLLDAENLVIFQKKKPKNVPSMTQKEFLEFEEANKLVKFLKDF